MIDPALFLQWILAMGAIILTPGPDTLLIMRNAANSGLHVGLATTAGVQMGLVFHTLLALFGISAVVASMPAIILVVGIFGALFIAYLAWQTWTAGVVGGNLHGHRQTTALAAFRDAMITNALNPKVILAYIAIMFSLISVDLPAVPQIVLMSLAAIIINSIWQTGLVLGSERLFNTLTDQKIQRRINRTMAAILLLLAILLPFQAIEKSRSTQAKALEAVITQPN